MVVDLVLFEQSPYLIVQRGKMTLFAPPKVIIYLSVECFHISDSLFSLLLMCLET